MRRIELDETLLRRLVEVEHLQQWKIAELLKVSRDTVGRRCKDLSLLTQRTGPRNGPDHPRWRGGRTIDKDGYVLVYSPDHRSRRKHMPYVLEHRLVMERHLGRRLRPIEVVHHRNGDKQDNRLANLRLFATNGRHLQHELGADPVHRLCAGCKMRRTSILLSLAGGEPLPPPTSPRSRTRRERDIRAACGRLRLRLPEWFHQQYRRS